MYSDHHQSSCSTSTKFLSDILSFEILQEATCHMPASLVSSNFTFISFFLSFTMRTYVMFFLPQINPHLLMVFILVCLLLSLANRNKLDFFSKIMRNVNFLVHEFQYFEPFYSNMTFWLWIKKTTAFLVKVWPYR